LPDHQFVFCSFNEFYKISESIFNAWMHVLSSTNDSVLYLAIRGDITVSDFQEKVERMGVNPARIIIADRIASFEEHLSRLSLCDLMLDTFPYNSHTTACDAIMAGLPLIAMRGQSFASRVSSSLLEHIGVPDLVANSVAEYRTKAIELAKNPDYYRAVRERVAAGRINLPSDKVYTQNLEALFSDMVRGREQKRGRFQVPRDKTLGNMS
jgi:predicted O-linked N-acetylglucosamine transferase (SPINDLY family)